MARIRSIHPGQATDEEFVEMSAEARLFCLLLRCEADDQGIFEWKPKALKMRIIPADDWDVGAILQELLQHQQVTQYTAEGKEYGAIRNFRKFQRPKKPNSLYPCTDAIRSYVGISSEPVPNQSPTDSEIPPQMEDVGCRMEDVIEEPPSEGGVSAPAPEKPKRKPPKRACQLPDDWQPQPQANAPMSMIGMTSKEIASETDKFRDHAKANGRTAKDWDAAYRNWVRKAMEFRATRRGPSLHAPPAEHPNRTRTREALEELARKQGSLDHAPEQPRSFIGGPPDDGSGPTSQWAGRDDLGRGSAEIIGLYGT